MRSGLELLERLDAEVVVDAVREAGADRRDAPQHLDPVAAQAIERAAVPGLDELDDDAREPRADLRRGLEADLAVIAKHVRHLAVVVADHARGLAPRAGAMARRALLLEQRGDLLERARDPGVRHTSRPCSNDTRPDAKPHAGGSRHAACS